MYHRITELVMVEGTFLDHLVHPPYSSKVSWNRLPRTMCSLVLCMSKNGDFTISLWQPVPVFDHLTVKKNRLLAFV